MKKKIEEQSWRTIHLNYLEFAVLAFRACREATSPPEAGLNRPVVETIRYAYDCLEASTEFVRHMGLLKELPGPLQENWLSRYLDHNWEQLSLSDRMGVLAYAWLGQRFWQTEKQFQLFEDLKQVREALVRPLPLGTPLEKEILARRASSANTVHAQSPLTGATRPPGSDRPLFNSKKAIAQFQANPLLLGPADAEKALEIMLCHLLRFEEIYFGECTPWFCFYDGKAQKSFSPKELLETINRRFKKIWD